MAHFLGKISTPESVRDVTKTGIKAGMLAEVAGWHGRITVRVWHDETSGRDRFRIFLGPHWSKDGKSNVIAEGFLDDKYLQDPFIPALIAGGV